MNSIKYFLYARKSTEDEERQVMSIEAQLAELEEFAKREKIEIVEKFVESKSAKKPGREVFNSMMSKVYSSSEPVGIIAWHPDRLARNSVDGGQIIYCIDTQKIASLRFPTFWFEPTPQGLFMLQVAFGQSKYYSDNLSENVRRGIRQKLRRGEWCSHAPLGYTNNAKTRNIEPDPVKARIIAKAFDEFAKGSHTLTSISERLSFWGLTSGTGKLLCKAVIVRMLTNKAYLGIIEHNGECYEGSFPAIVCRATFDKVQEVLKQRARPRKSKKNHDFPFVGLFHCGECGAMITAQWAKGKYRYYRCTKRLGHCSQQYLNEKELVSQLKQELSKVALCEDWFDKMMAQTEVWEKEAKESSHIFAQNLEKQINATDEKLDKLINTFLDGDIEKETYLVKKEELIKQKKTFVEQKRDFGRKGNNWIEPLKEWIISAREAEKLAKTSDLHEIKSYVQKIGTNHQLHNKNIFWKLKIPYAILREYNEKKCEAMAAFGRRSGAFYITKNNESLYWSGWRDSNSRPHDPQPCALPTTLHPEKAIDY